MPSSTRILNEIVVDLAKKSLERGEIPAIIYEAPTGYGKTTLSLGFYSILAKHGSASGLIHVLPMMSIATELYCKMINALGHIDERCREFGTDERIAKAIIESGVASTDIGYQFMDFIDSSKSPFYLKTILVTTFNSFFHNLFRFPVAEFRKRRRHYEVPRASILTSVVIFDEAHLYGGDPCEDSESSLITALIVSVKALVEAHAPILIESATLPSVFRNLVKTGISSVGVRPITISFRYGADKCRPDHQWSSNTECYDDDYVNRCLNVMWSTKIISEHQIESIVKEHVDVGHRILIVRNTVEKAIKTYHKLRNSFNDIELIHGRFTRKDRALKLLKCRSSKIVVSTQVIEAGVNMSFDVLIADMASPASVVQRAGRVARGCDSGNNEAFVYLVESDGDGVYDEYVVKLFATKVEDMIKRGHTIDWRIPSISPINDNRISFLHLLNESYQNFEIKLDPSRYISLLDIVSMPIISHNDLEKTYRKFGGLLYTSAIIPVYIGDEIPSNLTELMELSVPLSLNYVVKNNSKVLKQKSNGEALSVVALKCEDEGEECELVEGYVKRSLLNNPVDVLTYRELGDNYTSYPLSFWGRPEIYSRELGIRIGD